MKRFFKRIGILLLTVIILAAIAIGWIYRQSQPYLGTADTSITMVRTAKMLLRNGISQTNNPSLLSILQWSYNTLHNISVAKQSKTTKTKWEQVIQTQDNIIQMSIDTPWSIIPQIHTEPLETWDGILFSYGDQMIGYVEVYTTSWRDIATSWWVVNMEKIAESSGLVISYSQWLDNPFTGMELEIFGELSALFNQSIATAQITNIQVLEYTLWYIQKIQTGDNIVFTIDPIQLFTGEQAANTRLQNDPEWCNAAISWTDKTLCMPENDYYIVNSNTGDQVDLIFDEVSTIEVINISWENTMETIPTTIDALQKSFDKYQEIPFHIYYTNQTLLQLSEQYIP